MQGMGKRWVWSKRQALDVGCLEVGLEEGAVLRGRGLRGPAWPVTLLSLHKPSTKSTGHHSPTWYQLSRWALSRRPAAGPPPSQLLPR